MQGAKVSLYFAERALLSLHPCSKRCKRWPSNPSFRNPVRRLGTEPHWGPALRPELRHLHAHERSAGPSQSRVSRSDALSRSGTVLKFCQCQAVELRKPRLRNAADVESRPGRDCRPGSGCISSLPFTLLAHKRSTGSDSGRRRVEKMPCNATYNGAAKACQCAGHWRGTGRFDSKHCIEVRGTLEFQIRMLQGARAAGVIVTEWITWPSSGSPPGGPWMRNSAATQFRRHIFLYVKLQKRTDHCSESNRDAALASASVVAATHRRAGSMADNLKDFRTPCRAWPVGRARVQPEVQVTAARPTGPAGPAAPSGSPPLCRKFAPIDLGVDESMMTLC